MSAEKSQKTAIKEGVRYCVVFAAMLLLLAALVVWNINSGSVPLTVRQVVEILLGAGREETAGVIVWQIRLPRICAAVILGGALAVSGFLLQTFFSNPIAGPFVLGISSGAKLFVALVMIWFLGRGHGHWFLGYGSSGICRFHALHGLRAAGRKKSEPDVHAGGLRCHDQLYLFGCDGLCGDICR